MPALRLCIPRPASAIAAAAVVAAAAATGQARAGAIGTHGTLVGALPGSGSMVFSGGYRAPESELVRTDRYGNEAAARALLSDGALHASAQAHYDQPDSCRWNPSTCLTSTAQAQVELWDIVTFTRSELADPSQIRWRFDIHGFETNGPLHGGTAGARFSYQVDTRHAWSPTTLFAVNDGDTIRGSIEMSDETLTVRVYAGLTVYASMGGWADYGNTARFFLELPEGVAFTSQSNMFLADRPPAAPVPEPPAAAVLAAGLVVVGWLRRRRQSH